MERIAMNDGLIHFTALKDFHSDELGCDYYQGLGYTARQMEKHDKLRALLPSWIEKGLVRYGRGLASAAVKGTGKVETLTTIATAKAKKQKG